jgi:hypothetical protein
MSHISAEQPGSHLDHLKSTGGSTYRKRIIPLVLFVVGWLTAGCSTPPPPVRARSFAAIVAEKLPILRPPQQNVADDRRRFKDAPVYIDGRRAGVIRPLEVPAGLKPYLRKRPGVAPAPRYSIAEYISAAGGHLAKVREVHLYGGRTRVSVIAGDELRKHTKDFFFLFTGGARGKPRIGWPPDGIKTNSSIDIVVAVAVYEDKDPPVFDEKEGVMRLADGKPIEGIPYAPAEELKGTRFYADGVLLGWMKRKTLPNSILLPGSDVASGEFSLAAFVASLGVDPRKVRGIELIQDDDAVAHLDGSALVREPPLVFTLPRRSQGNLVLRLPPSVFSPPPSAAGPVPVRVSAVQLFLKLAAPTRTYAKVDDLVEKEGDRERRGSGSGSDQGDSEN